MKPGEKLRLENRVSDDKRDIFSPLLFQRSILLDIIGTLSLQRAFEITLFISERNRITARFSAAFPPDHESYPALSLYVTDSI